MTTDEHTRKPETALEAGRGERLDSHRRAPVDRETVARLRRAITAGTYGIDPLATAKAMIDADLPPRDD